MSALRGLGVVRSGLRLLSLPLLLVLLLTLSLFLLPRSVHSLTVHMVPHTHDDVGWLKTVDQYFIGSNNSLQHASVTNLITATVAALKRVSERRFVYVEQAFFQRWWREQDEAMRADVRALVEAKQLEFINGGWCMHDEAATHYVDMIDQTTLGHQYIVQQFGEAANPTIGWQVDPFGHSATQAALLGHEVGFDALFFGRIEYQDHDWRVRDKEMQFSWAPSPSLGPASQVWSEAALDGNYNPPDGLCWDYLCDSGSNPFVQDRDDLEDKNIDSRVADFIKAAHQYAATRKGDLATMNVSSADDIVSQPPHQHASSALCHVLTCAVLSVSTMHASIDVCLPLLCASVLPCVQIQFNMGTDFNYESAEQYFINMDKIIAGVNRNGSVRALYSTPSTYYRARMAENITWSVKTDDFFPCQHTHPFPCPNCLHSDDSPLVWCVLSRWDGSKGLSHWILHLPPWTQGLRPLLLHHPADRSPARGLHRRQRHGHRGGVGGHRSGAAPRRGGRHRASARGV